MAHAELRLPDGFSTEIVAEIRHHLSASRDAYIPSPEELAELLRVAFWASLARDEGREPIFTISVRPERSDSRVLGLARPLPFDPETLTRFSMATAPDLSAVHVGPSENGLKIFGIDTLLGTAAPVRLEVRGPATLIVKSASASVAVFTQNRADLIERLLYQEYTFIDRTFPIEDEDAREHEYRLDWIVRSMFDGGHGGTLLILPSGEMGSDMGLDVLFKLEPMFEGLASVASEAASSGASQWAQLRRKRYIAAMGRTTSVDGATVVTQEGSLIGFGAKIVARAQAAGERAVIGPLRIRRLLPVKRYEETIVNLSEFGGTRHQSAATFVARCPGSIAAVASHDGKLSFLTRAKHGADVDCLEHAEWLF